MYRSEAIDFLNNLLAVDVMEIIDNYQDSDATDMQQVMLSGYDLLHILEALITSEDEDLNDGQPDWIQEWEDFGERYE
jgi:hypothetical protein